MCPLRAESLKGVARAVVTVADVDMLRDEGIKYAERLVGEGVQVRLRKVNGVGHGFVGMDGLKEWEEYVRDCCEELKKAFVDGMDDSQTRGFSALSISSCTL